MTLIARVADEAAALGRADLAGELRRHLALAEPDQVVVVAGAFKAGKSRFVNELLGTDLCPSDVATSTVVPTVLRGHAGEPVAVAVSGDGSERGDANEPGASGASGAPSGSEGEHDPGGWRRTALSVGAARRQVTAPDLHDLRWIELGLDRPLLTSGVVIIDTPGSAGATGPARRFVEQAAGPAAVVVFVASGLVELRDSDVAFLEQLRARCPRLLVVVTKTDIDRRWARIVELDRAHLDSCGLADVALLPVSAALGKAARARGDAALDDRAGFRAVEAELGRRLEDDRRSRREAMVTARSEATATCALLERGLTARLALLDDPEAIAGLEADAAAAKDRVDALRRSDVWRTALSDGITMLTADADFDFRDRLRAIGKELDERIEAGDPLKDWDEVRSWLEEELARTLVEHRDFIDGRARALGDRLLAMVDEEAAHLDLGVAELAVVRTALPREIDVKPTGATASAMTAMKGTYGSIAMFGMFTSMIGMSLVNPITLVATVGMSSKALRDERKRQLAQRRQVARSAGRAAIEEANHLVGKWSRDEVRATHRRLRDAVNERVEELQVSADAALASARSTLQSDQADRRARRQRLEAHLQVVRELASALADDRGAP